MGRVYLHLGYIHHFSLVTLCRLQKECINHSLSSNRSSRRADFTGQVTCFFAFAPRTVFLLCFSFIVCGVLPTGVLWWLHIPHTLTLRYVTFVCNNTLDILPDVRYRVVFLVYIVSLSHHHRMNDYVNGHSDSTLKDSTVCPFIICIRVSNMCVCSAVYRVSINHAPVVWDTMHRPYTVRIGRVHIQFLYSAVRRTAPIRNSCLHLSTVPNFSSASWTPGFVIDSVNNVVTGVQTGTSTPKGPTATR